MKLEPSTLILLLSYVLLRASFSFLSSFLSLLFGLLFLLVFSLKKKLSSDVELLVAERFWQLQAYLRGSAKLWLEFGLMEIRYFTECIYVRL